MRQSATYQTHLTFQFEPVLKALLWTSLVVVLLAACGQADLSTACGREEELLRQSMGGAPYVAAKVGLLPGAEVADAEARLKARAQCRQEAAERQPL